MEFDLRELEIFCAVVEQQSFTRAAARVHLAQASVSERIANLEQSIGVKLLDRSGRGVTPTAVGRLLYEGARALLEKRQELVFELEDLLGVRAGVLTVGASTIPGEFMLPGRLASFRASYPDILLRVHIGGSEGIAAQVVAGALEIGLVSSGLDHPELVSTPLWGDELVVAVAADHPWAERELVGFDELCREPFILREPGSGTRRALEHAIASQTSKDIEALQVVAELGSTAAVKEGVLQGLGVSILSGRALKRELASASVAICHLEGIDLSRSIDLIRHRRRNLSPAASCFAEYLAENAAGSVSEVPIPD